MGILPPSCESRERSRNTLDGLTHTAVGFKSDPLGYLARYSRGSHEILRGSREILVRFSRDTLEVREMQAQFAGAECSLIETRGFRENFAALFEGVLLIGGTCADLIAGWHHPSRHGVLGGAETRLQKLSRPATRGSSHRIPPQSLRAVESIATGTHDGYGSDG
jgi:hypothetical protein